jgi:predicted enzyme related to lactoylglutathione lyase
VERLADFYEKVFGCKRLSPGSVLTGDAMARGTGVPNAEIRGVWFQMPGIGEGGPILELFQYSHMHERQTPLPNQPGYGHLSFEVSDIAATADAVVTAGGSRFGAIADFETPSEATVGRDSQ